MAKLFLRRCSALPTQLQEPMTDQSIDTTKTQLDELMSFIGVTYRSMAEGLLAGAEMTQTQHHHQNLPQHE